MALWLITLGLFLQVEASLASDLISTLDLSLTSIQHDSFGKNPGNLDMYYYVPEKAPPETPLVVLLHGCKQRAIDFSRETGWTKLAEKNKFYLLLPQQKKINNHWNCFNWFNPSDNTRGQGEAASIAHMIYKIKKTFPIHSQQVFIVGLSAGGSMASVMMANYPELFRGGAMVAGVPYGCASSRVQAWNCMRALSLIDDRIDYGEAVLKAASHHQGPFPKVIVVHSYSDKVVKFKNAQLNIGQWTYVHQTDSLADEEKIVDGQKLQIFKRDRQAENHKIHKEVVGALLTIEDQPHGYPVDPQKGCGQTNSFVLDSGVCTSEHIAQFWGIFK